MWDFYSIELVISFYFVPLCFSLFSYEIMLVIKKI